MPLPGLRMPNYSGSDPQVQKLARGVSDVLTYLSTLPFSDGVPILEQDFGAPKSASNANYELKHGLKRKARGVTVISCRCKYDPPALPMSQPVHVKNLDTDSIAYVCLSAAMASDFIWSFWVF
jgi:hypothetical protein